MTPAQEHEYRSYPEGNTEGSVPSGNYFEYATLDGPRGLGICLAPRDRWLHETEIFDIWKNILILNSLANASAPIFP